MEFRLQPLDFMEFFFKATIISFAKQRWSILQKIPLKPRGRSLNSMN